MSVASILFQKRIGRLAEFGYTRAPIAGRGRKHARISTVTQSPPTFAFKIYGLIVTTALAVFAAVGAAIADDFPLIGSYTQNVPCKGDGSDAKEVLVQISAQEIVSNLGVCTILNTKHDGDSFLEHVECKFPAGPMMGDISFTPRPDQTIDFVDRDSNYKAILHRCPN